MTACSLEARLFLPPKTYAYGMPPNCFCDYFQISFTLKSVCSKEFDKMIVGLHKTEPLRLPTVKDVQLITKLHKAKYKLDGHLGRLDCTHNYWANCPLLEKVVTKGD
jgi:hypothetical protein